MGTKSLLTLCTEVAEDIGVFVPTAVYGQSDETARRLKSAATREGDFLLRHNEWQVLLTAGTITLATGDSDYAFPSDYDRHVDNTMWDTSEYWQVRGPRSPQEWAAYNNAIVSISPRFHFRKRGDQILIWPTPTSDDNGDTISYEYVRNTWILDNSNADTPVTAWTADADTQVFDDHLFFLGMRWRYLQSVGRSYIDEKAEYEETLDERVASDKGNRTIHLGNAPVAPYPNIQEGNFPSS